MLSCQSMEGYLRPGCVHITGQWHAPAPCPFCVHRAAAQGGAPRLHPGAHGRALLQASPPPQKLTLSVCLHTHTIPVPQ